MKSLKGLVKEFSRSMEAAAYAEAGEHATARNIMAEDISTSKAKGARPASQNRPLTLKPTGASR